MRLDPLLSFLLGNDLHRDVGAVAQARYEFCAYFEVALSLVVVQRQSLEGLCDIRSVGEFF